MYVKLHVYTHIYIKKYNNLVHVHVHVLLSTPGTCIICVSVYYYYYYSWIERLRTFHCQE